jgi:hypothetical protein
MHPSIPAPPLPPSLPASLYTTVASPSRTPSLYTTVASLSRPALPPSLPLYHHPSLPLHPPSRPVLSPSLYTTVASPSCLASPSFPALPPSLPPPLPPSLYHRHLSLLPCPPSLSTAAPSSLYTTVPLCLSYDVVTISCLSCCRSAGFPSLPWITHQHPRTSCSTRVGQTRFLGLSWSSTACCSLSLRAHICTDHDGTFLMGSRGCVLVGTMNEHRQSPCWLVLDCGGLMVYTLPPTPAVPGY